MKAYEDLLYEQWRQQVEVTLPVLLKKNLLARPEVTATAKLPEIETGGKTTKPTEGRSKFSHVEIKSS